MSGGISQFLETVRTLKLIQITNRIKRRFLPTSVSPIVAARRRNTVNPLQSPITTKSIALCGNAHFLNVSRSVDSPTIWNDNACSRLWLYQLHYFDGLAGVASNDAAAARAFIERWIKENPVGAGPGWEPFPVSLRVCNWIKFAMLGGELSQVALDSLATQTAWLRTRLEFHLLGNHLLLNACALYCAGCFFEVEEAEEWRATGDRLIAEQIREQVLADGTHFELSAMYQLMVLEALLDVVNVSQATGFRAPENLTRTCEAMVAALDVLTHTDGTIVQFNDAALDEAPAASELRAYARRLGLELASRSAAESAWLPQAGYARLCAGNAVALVDVAEIGPSYLPAHAHADTLSFEMSVGGRRVIVDTGISTYEANTARQLERGTAAHNTVTIDDRNSSDVWLAFRVGARARILRRSFESADGVSVVHGAHDGYRRIGVVHARTWRMQSERLEIVDELEGDSTHRIECAFHFHPDCLVELGPGHAVVRHADGTPALRIDLDPGLEWSVADYDYHPGFGITHRAKRLRGQAVCELPKNLTQTFRWEASQ